MYAAGRLQPATDILRADESEFLAVAEGVFETLLGGSWGLRDGAAHWARLRDGVANSGWERALGEPVATLAARVAESVPWRYARVRVAVGERGRGVETWVSAQSWRPGRAGEAVALGVSAEAHPATSLRGVKSLAWRRTALALQQEHGTVFDVVVCDNRGRVQEGSRSSLFVRLGDRAVTPPLSDGCLPGTVRRRLLESGRVREETVSLDALLGADEVAVANSLAGVLPVRRIGEASIPVRDLAARLQETWLQEIE